MAASTQSFFANEGNPLAGVNVDTTSEVIKNKYDTWATKYDEDMVKYSYASPNIAVKKLVELAEIYGVNRESEICDLGAGTGIVGGLLKKEGFERIDAVDISPQMLEIAKEKGCYNQLICAGLGDGSISITNKYKALLCIGCFTLGHIKPSGLDEMVHMVQPGGLLLFTVRQDAIENEVYGYKSRIDELVSTKKMSVISQEKIDYIHGANEDDLARNCYLFACLRQ